MSSSGREAPAGIGADGRGRPGRRARGGGIDDEEAIVLRENTGAYGKEVVVSRKNKRTYGKEAMVLRNNTGIYGKEVKGYVRN